MYDSSDLIQEFQKRASHAHNQYVPGDIPGWDQLSFHESTDRYRMVFGGNQSGKSYTAAYEIACWLRGRHPHRSIPSGPIQVWCISAEYATLEEDVYRHLLGSGDDSLLPEWEIKTIGPKVPQQNLPSYVEMKNGSLVRFKSAKGDARQKFQAAAVDLISIDEEITRDGWDELQVRTLKTGGNFIISATLVESYDWITDLENKAESGTPGYFLTRLHTEANPHLHKETVEFLKTVLSEEELEIRYAGKSRRTTGLIYKNFSKEKHVIEPFEIPDNYLRWQALDPGIRTFAGVWIALSPPPTKAYVYREMYEHNTPLYEIAVTIKTLEGFRLNKELSEEFEHFVWEERDNTGGIVLRAVEHIVERFIDDKRHARLITGEEGVLEQLASRYGIMTTPADKDKRPGIEDVRYWLEHDLYVFDTCENFIREMLRYRIRPLKTTGSASRTQNDPIDEPVKQLDHLMDCIRYLAREQLKWNKLLLPRKSQISSVTGSQVLADILEKKRIERETHSMLGSI